MAGHSGGHIDAVELVVVRLGKIVFPALHNDVTRSAGAASTARMLKLNTKIQRDIENGLWLAMVGVRELPGFEFDSLAEVGEGDLGHIFILACPIHAT